MTLNLFTYQEVDTEVQMAYRDAHGRKKTKWKKKVIMRTGLIICIVLPRKRKRESARWLQFHILKMTYEEIKG